MKKMWEGKDLGGIPFNPVMEHIEGKYDKQFTRAHIKSANRRNRLYRNLIPEKHRLSITLPLQS